MFEFGKELDFLSFFGMLRGRLGVEFRFLHVFKLPFQQDPTKPQTPLGFKMKMLIITHVVSSNFDPCFEMWLRNVEVEYWWSPDFFF